MHDVRVSRNVETGRFNSFGQHVYENRFDLLLTHHEIEIFTGSAELVSSTGGDSFKLFPLCHL